MATSTVIRWWRGRAAREQVLLTVLAVLLAGLTLVYGIYQPLLAFKARSERHYAQAAADHQAIMPLVASVKAASGREGQRLTAETLQSWLDDSTKAQGLSLSNYTPMGDGKVSFWVSGTSTGAVMGWLMDLEQLKNYRLSEATITRDDAGRANLEVVLEDQNL